MTDQLRNRYLNDDFVYGLEYGQIERMGLFLEKDGQKVRSAVEIIRGILPGAFVKWDNSSIRNIVEKRSGVRIGDETFEMLDQIVLALYGGWKIYSGN